MTLKQLADKIHTSDNTLICVEKDKIKYPYYYWKLICGYFNINHIQYLDINKMNETTIQEKLVKIRAYLGAKTWEDVSHYLGYTKSYAVDSMKHNPRKKKIEELDSILKGFLN